MSFSQFSRYFYFIAVANRLADKQIPLCDAKYTPLASFGGNKHSNDSFALTEKYAPKNKVFEKSLNISVLVLLVELLAEIFEITAEYRVPYSFHQLVKIGYVMQT